MAYRCLHLLSFVIALLLAGPARAQSAAPAEANAVTAPRPVAVRAEGCFPTCRSGFTCHLGQCVSLCNPPCASGETCVAGARCASQGSTAQPIYEPPPPPVKGFATRTHLALGFHWGFSGDAEQGSATSELDSTLGVNLRSDLPVARYLLIGPLLQLGAWRPDLPNSTPSRNYYFDLDLFVRGRLPFELPSLELQAWIGVPIGLSFSFLGDDRPTGLESFSLGWNVGFLVGGAVHFSKNFGLFSEIGWMQHKMTHDASAGDSVSFRLSQACLNVGVIFRN